MITTFHVLMGFMVGLVVIVVFLGVAYLRLRSRVLEVEDAVKEHAVQLGRLNQALPSDGSRRERKIGRS